MKKQYDFSKGVKRKFYIPQNKIELPVYLDKENQDYYMKLASEKKVEISKLINTVLSKDKDLIDSAISK
jgi:hypothetical protein